MNRIIYFEKVMHNFKIEKNVSHAMFPEIGWH